LFDFLKTQSLHEKVIAPNLDGRYAYPVNMLLALHESKCLLTSLIPLEVLVGILIYIGSPNPLIIVEEIISTVKKMQRSHRDHTHRGKGVAAGFTDTGQSTNTRCVRGSHRRIFSKEFPSLPPSTETSGMYQKDDRTYLEYEASIFEEEGVHVLHSTIPKRDDKGKNVVNLTLFDIFLYHGGPPMEATHKRGRFFMTFIKNNHEPDDPFPKELLRGWRRDRFPAFPLNELLTAEERGEVVDLYTRMMS
jgi:hypothetical protein